MRPISDIIQFQEGTFSYGKTITGKLEFRVSQQLPNGSTNSIDAIAMAKEKILSYIWEELYGDIMRDFQKAIQISRRFESKSYNEMYSFQEMLDTTMKKIRGLR
jgi:hypothetical protein